jgi:beta-galactosidase
VVGYNYLEQFYAADHEAFPQRIILGSENSHSLAAWRAVASNKYVLGQFLWTGVDYLGESGLYPARGSASGLLDFCGFRKPLSYLREALWSDRPMVYAAAYESRPASARPGRLAEHWNWEQDARKSIPVAVYTNCSSAELLLNGRSLGEKQLTDRLDPVLRWDVPNEPGTVQVIGKRDGREAARFALATAEKPDHLELHPDRAALSADGSDLAHIEIRVVDRTGRRVIPFAHPITVRVTGAGQLVAVDSGNPTDVTPVSAGHRNAFEGRILAIVRPAGIAGTITIHASSPDLRDGEIGITVR